jgi:hypothetical protein
MTREEPNSVEERIHFWLCEERRCVSIKFLTMEFDRLTRQEAADFLEKYLAKHSSNGDFEVTRCVFEENGLGKLVLRLSKSSVDGSYICNSDIKGSNIYSVCPLAASGNEKKLIAVSSIQAAHEVDRVKEREGFLSTEGKVKPLRSIIYPSLTSPEDSAVWTEAKENSIPTSPKLDPHLVSGNAQGHDISTLKTSNSISTKGISTSAASFFSSSIAKTQNLGSPMPEITCTAHARKNDGAQQKASADNPKVGNPIVNKGFSKKLIGNADDFVGDESSEEETCFEPQNGQQSEKTILTKTKQNGHYPAQGTIIDKTDTISIRKQKRDEKKESDFATASTTNKSFDVPQQKLNSNDEAATAKRVRHRQRKKYVEQTTMDENGYMRTETICVMEDIATDEEDQQQKMSVNKSMISKIGTNSKEDSKGKHVVGNKKQMGLSAFFTTKKK